jgi:deazaflavin-dependent oxidoreductase (nitroreductase family)
MPLPRWVARVNLRVTNHILGPLARRLPGMGVVVHVGRKTHRSYRTPVMVFRRDNRVIIALTYGHDSQWVQNVLAEKSCELETEDRKLRLINPQVVHDERRLAMPAFVLFVLGLLHVADFLELSIASQ